MPWLEGAHVDPIVIILFVGLAVIALVMVYTRTYLNIMGADEKCRSTWKVLEASLARRGELVSSLEEAMAGRGGHGREALEALSRARGAVDAVEGPADKIVASQALTQTLREIFAVAERSTALMTDPGLVALMGQIAEAENDLEQARKAYDEEVRGYNALVTSFPGNKIGGMRYRPRMSVRAGQGGDGTGRELPWTRF